MDTASTSRQTEAPLVVTSFEEAAQIIRADEFGAPDPPEGGFPFVGESVLHLNGDEHRIRRRLEAPLFSKSAVLAYEAGLLQAATARQILRPTLLADGTATWNLVAITRRAMLEIAAALIGVDIDGGIRLELLERCMYPLTEAVELAWTEGNRDEIIREGLEAKEIFAREFIEPAIATATAPRTEEQPPTLVELLVGAGANHDLVCREAIVFLAGATLTTSTAIVNTVLQLESWFEAHPEDRDRVRDDQFLLAATNETLRLMPTAPYLPRTALVDTRLPDGRAVQAGDVVMIDRAAIHRDTSVFGSDAATFNPHRRTPERIASYGIAFGGGRHQCIGRPLVSDARPTREGEPRRAIPVILATLYQRGLRLDSSRTGTRAPSAQHRYDDLPVLFTDWR
jgi:cytochrome P450